MVFIIQEIPVAKILSLQLSSTFQTCCKNFGMNFKATCMWFHVGILVLTKFPSPVSNYSIKGCPGYNVRDSKVSLV